MKADRALELARRTVDSLWNSSATYEDHVRAVADALRNWQPQDETNPITLKLTPDELRDLISVLMKTRRYPLLLARLMTLVELKKPKKYPTAES